MKKDLTTFELFAGTGGLALGTHLGGFTHLGLLEKNKYAVETLRSNSSHLGLAPENIFEADAASFDFSTYEGKIDLLTGGPPCQPFSTAGRNRGPEDARNMFPEFFRATREIRPKALLIENVKGLCRAKFRPYLDYILLSLKHPFEALAEKDWERRLAKLLKIKGRDDDEHYHLTWQLVDSANYGIPQQRHRILIFGYRADLNKTPKLIPPTHSKERLLIDQFVTGSYWIKHGIRAQDYLMQRDKNVLEGILARRLKGYPIPEVNLAPWCTVRDATTDLPEPVKRGEQETFPNHTQHPGAKIYPNHIGSFMDFPAKALKAGTHGTPGGENMVRRNERGAVRYFTTREAARLQSFPDRWHFRGSWGSCIKQLGNAVPVQLMQLFSAPIRSSLLR